MLIEHRDPGLKYPRAIKEEKTRLVLDWLLEFRFSSVGILAKRIGSTAVNSNRFFNTLLNDGVIQSFKNVHTKNDRYFMLALPGVSYLEAEGRDVSKAVTRVRSLGRYSQIVHDIAVQKAVLSRVNDYQEVIWDRHIESIDSGDRPDALLKHKKGYWAALEYERWRKDTKRIFMAFVAHAKAIQEQRYSGVYYLFDKAVDKTHYEKLFSAEEWPRYKRQAKTGRIVALSQSFNANQVTNLKKCFVFLHEPVD